MDVEEKHTGVGPDLLVRKHHLPHWQQGGSVYFLTFRSVRGSLPENALAALRDVVYRGHGYRFTLVFGVLMPDHTHLLLRPLERVPAEWYDLAEITKGIKGTSARRINVLLERTGSVWQSESHDRIVRTEADFRVKYQYMLNNPLKKGLVDRHEDYRWYVYPPEENEGREYGE